MDLYKLPGTFCKISKKDLREIETDREKFWNRFFLRIEESFNLSGDSVAIHEIDDPRRVDERAGSCCELYNSINFQRWIRDHEDYIDELTTIAGSPAEDEEEIEDEEETEEDVEEISDDNESADQVNMEDNIDIEEEEVIEEEVEEISNDEESADEDDMENSIDECYSQTDEDLDENDIQDASEVSEDGSDEKISCCQCDKTTIYCADITEDEEEFQCDFCLLGTHADCEVDCDECRDIAAKVERRWQVVGMEQIKVLQILKQSTADNFV